MISHKLFIAAALSLGLILLGCKGPDTATQDMVIDTPVDAIKTVHSLRRQFTCLPQEAAFVAAHRGVSKGQGYAENSLSSLKALMDHGIMVAEIDVAGLKDGTHILFHDGIWDEKSTGRGSVAASNWGAAQKILLEDTEGKASGDRPVKFSEVLAVAKNRLYLEVDFKSSAKYETVIQMIKDAGMGEQVVLIAYSEGQARKLARLAPDMMVSIGSDIKAYERVGVKRSNMAVWMGKGPYPKDQISNFRSKNIPVLAWPNRNRMKQTAGAASVLVTDYALKYDPIIGLSKKGREEYQACLVD